MSISSGEQPTVPESESVPAPDDQGTENGSVEQLRREVEVAKANFLKIAATEGPSFEIAIEAYTAYNDLLISLSETIYQAYPIDRPNPELDRELWLATEIYNTSVKANEINPAYQEMLNSSKEDLEMVQ